MSPSVGCVQVAKNPEKCEHSPLILLILAIHCKSKDYSITVATRPEPTVRPPSRFVGYIILLLLGVFQTLFYLYYFKFSLIFEVLIFFRTIVEPRMHKLCFYIYSKPLDLLEYTISNNSPVVSKALNLASKSSSSVFTTALTLSGFS